jgi:hypothetical protein
VGTRLEGQVQRGTARALAGRAEREDLGVGAARAPMPRLADDAACLHDHTADHRVRVGLPETPGREGQGMPHPTLVVSHEL